MKNIFIAVSLLFVCACSNLERNAYVTIGSVGASANAAIGSYQLYTQTHTPTPAETATARKVVQAYVDAMEGARHAVESLKAGLVTQSAVDAALNALSAAAGDMSKVLVTLSQKTTP